MKAFFAAARLATIITLIGLAAAAGAQPAFPTRPVRFIVPYPPGGGTDPVARIVGQKLGDKWAQQVLVDNRPGGNTIIGCDIVAKAAPDGYTLLILPTTIAIIANLLPLPFDPVKDFDGIATLARSPYVLVVHPSLPATNLKELVALAKSKPGQLNYGSAGTATTPHLGTELLSIMTGIKMQHVPYKGSGPMTYDLLSGQVQLAFNNTISVMAPLIDKGKLKGIAVSSDTRLPALPHVPTFAEAGLRGFELLSWFALAAPAGTPKTIIDKVSSEVRSVLALADTQDSLAKQGMEAFVSTSPEQVNTYVKAEIARYGKIIKAANIKLEN